MSAKRAPKPIPNRYCLLCPVCNTSKECLSMHLERACMKNATKEARVQVVEKAKQDANLLLRSGRVYTYQLLKDIMDTRDPLKRMIEELEKRHNLVVGVPAVASASEPHDAQAGPSTATGQPRSPEEDNSKSSGETFQCGRSQRWTVNKRVRMAEMGLYGRHSLDHPLLARFARYLEKDLGIENYKQEVENVARFLYYVDPNEPSLLFVREREKTVEYLRKLNEARLTKQTQLNYLKSLKRFLKHLTAITNLYRDDISLCAEANLYIDFIGALQKQLGKGVSKEIVAKRERIIRGDMNMTPRDCTAVLRAARDDFLAVLAKIYDSTPKYNCQLETAECLVVLYYLEAVVVLKHLQRPGVVEHMTIEEWKNRTKQDRGYVAVAVKEHKTAAQEVAVFVLSQEEEDWFHMYFEYIRDQLRSTKRCRANPDAEKVEEDPQERFFLSTSGKPIHSCSNDLARLHRKHSLTPVSSQVARRVFETAAKKLPDAEKSFVANYLSHSTATAEKHYRMKLGVNMLKAVDIIETMTADTREYETAGPSSRSHPKYTKPQMDFQAEWHALCKDHPVTVAGRVPALVDRVAASKEGQRRLYDRWLKKQMKLRIQHVVAQFPRRLPTEGRVTKCIAEQGWQQNIPSAARILEAWQPTGDLLQIP